MRTEDKIASKLYKQQEQEDWKRNNKKAYKK